MFLRRAPKKGKAVSVGSNGLYPVYNPDNFGWYDQTAFNLQEQLNGAVVVIYIKSVSQNLTGGYYVVGGYSYGGITTYNTRYTPGTINGGSYTISGISIPTPPATRFVAKFDCNGLTSPQFHLYDQATGLTLNHAYNDDIAIISPFSPTNTSAWFQLDFGSSNSSPQGLRVGSYGGISYCWYISSDDNGWGGVQCKNASGPLYPNDQCILQIVTPSSTVQNYQNMLAAQTFVQSQWGTSRLNQLTCCSDGANSIDGSLVGSKYMTFNGQSIDINQFRVALCKQNAMAPATPTTPTSQCDAFMASYCAANPNDSECACFTALANMNALLKQIGPAAQGVPISPVCLVDCASAPNAYRTSSWIQVIANGCVSAVCFFVCVFLIHSVCSVLRFLMLRQTKEANKLFPQLPNIVIFQLPHQPPTRTQTQTQIQTRIQTQPRHLLRLQILTQPRLKSVSVSLSSLLSSLLI